jgi:hypothetical protein
MKARLASLPAHVFSVMVCQSRRVCKHPGERMLPLRPSALGLTDRGNCFMLTRVACGIAAAVSGVKAAASGVP